MDRAEDFLRVLSKYVEELSQLAQSFGVAPLAALLFIPVLTAALARKFTLALVAMLLSVVSLLLFVDPTSATSGLAIASGLGSFLVALESIVALKQTTALKEEIADMTRRLDQLENAEHRRLLLEVKARHETTSNNSPCHARFPQISVWRTIRAARERVFGPIGAHLLATSDLGLPAAPATLRRRNPRNHNASPLSLQRSRPGSSSPPNPRHGPKIVLSPQRHRKPSPLPYFRKCQTLTASPAEPGDLPGTLVVAVCTTCHGRCRKVTSRSCGVSTDFIWSSPSPARGC